MDDFALPSDGEVRQAIKLIDIEIGDLIANGPAADWPEMDQRIWLFIHDGNLDDGFDGKAWGERIIKALTVLNQIENES